MNGMDCEYFYGLAVELSLIRKSKTRDRQTRLNHRDDFKLCFGIPAIVCSIVWKFIHTLLNSGAQPDHLLWTLLFLKSYPTESVLELTFKKRRETIRKLVLHFVSKYLN